MSNEKKVKVKIQDLYKVFGNNTAEAIELAKKNTSKDEILKKTKCAIGVNNANFEIYEGETLVVMGLSGSGKSTLLRCINRLIEPTTGSIFIDNEDITKFKNDEIIKVRRKKFGMVFQRFALFPHRTVLQNTEYGLEIQETDEKEMREKAMNALELVGLKGWENYFPEQLSGGMQQRVGLARALAIDPDILLMDEAFSALDPLIRSDMQDELLELAASVHKTIIFITHDLDEALKLGDRIVLMKDGRVVQVGTPEDILSNPANDYVEKFVENVDVIKVLTAKDVMVPAAKVFKKDGARIALRKMKEIGLPRVLVQNKDKEFVGLVKDTVALKAVETGNKDFESIIEKDVQIVNMDTPLEHILTLELDDVHPVVVLQDDNKKVAGVIVHSSIMASLAERIKGGTKEDDNS